ncbi:MAG TPA: hypothetical protein VJ371_10135, partial [Streptosporangiaceae bacterium]|nr:hypothetical protein [Streptosporangiaceae bacterium]
ARRNTSRGIRLTSGATASAPTLSAAARREPERAEAELDGVPARVAVLERLLPVEQQLVRVPEPALQRSG